MLSVVMLNVILLSVIMLSVIMLSDVTLSVFMLSVITLSVIMLSVIKLSVVMLIVMAPLQLFRKFSKFSAFESLSIDLYLLHLFSKKKKIKIVFFFNNRYKMQMIET